MTPGAAKRPRHPVTCPTVFLLPLILAAQTAVAQTWNVGDTSRAGQWTVYNRTADGSVLGFPLAAGDMNGDGLSDLILTPMNADSGPAKERLRAGEAVIVLSDGAIGGELDLAPLSPLALPADVTFIYGADALDLLGTEVFAGDLDDDGYEDAIIGAQYGDGADNGRPNCGDVAIVWGGMGIGGRVIDLRAPEPTGAVTFVYGAEPGDRLGIWVGAGDFDGDGITDAVLGADQGDGPANARTHAGETYVLYGGAALRALGAVDLAAPAVEVTVVYGIDGEDHSGATVRASDVDRDGVGDLLIGAGLNRLSAQFDADGGFSGHATAGGDGPGNVCDPTGLRCERGEAYVVYGVRGERPGSIDLADPPASTTFVYGDDEFDTYGEELFAGDFNGDGFGDVMIGALVGDGPVNTRRDAGEAALIYGGPTLRGSTIDLSGEPAGVVRFFGALSGDITGDTALLGDVDGDGRDDLVLSSPTAPVGPLSKAGTVHIFFGTPEPLPPSIDLAAIPAGLSVLRIEAGTADDILSYSSSAGDFDGDGRADPLLNLMGADGFEDRLDYAGDSVTLSGRELARAAGRLVEPPCAGDCNLDGAVSIDELVKGVQIALTRAALDLCTSLDSDDDGIAELNELVAAVSHAIRSCPDAVGDSKFQVKPRHASTSARQHVSTSARQHVSTSARQHVSTSARQHVSTSAPPPLDPFPPTMLNSDDGSSDSSRRLLQLPRPRRVSDRRRP